MDVSAILVNYNTAEILHECLDDLASASMVIRLRIFVVDNASRDRSMEVLRKRDDVEITENRTNVGFGRANNQVLDRIASRYVLLLNTDAFVEPDALEKTVAYMDAHPRCGVLGVRLLGRDGALQPSCPNLSTPWYMFLLRTGLHRLAPRTRMIDDPNRYPAALRRCDWGAPAAASSAPARGDRHARVL